VKPSEKECSNDYRIVIKYGVVLFSVMNLEIKNIEGLQKIVKDKMLFQYFDFYNIYTKAKYLFLLICMGMVSCTDNNTENSRTRKPVYVSPSVDKRGRIRKGYVRMPVSTHKNAISNQNKSRYYYQTRGKYHHRSRP